MWFQLPELEIDTDFYRTVAFGPALLVGYGLFLAGAMRFFYT